MIRDEASWRRFGFLQTLSPAFGRARGSALPHADEAPLVPRAVKHHGKAHEFLLQEQVVSVVAFLDLSYGRIQILVGILCVLDVLKFDDDAAIGEFKLEIRATFRVLMLGYRRKSRSHEEALQDFNLSAPVSNCFSGSIIVDVDSKCMQFVSIGGLQRDIGLEDIRRGISRPRNRRPAEIFHRAKLVEAYGIGIRRIFEDYRDCPVQPQIEISPNTFTMVLPNRNAAVDPHKQETPRRLGAVITPQMQEVKKYLLP